MSLKLVSSKLDPKSSSEKERIYVRMAQNESEVQAAQKLRYQVFYKEFGAKASDEILESQRDFDEFDAVADVDSAGIHAFHEGSPPDSRAVKEAAARGYDIKSLISRTHTGFVANLGCSLISVCECEGFMVCNAFKCPSSMATISSNS